MYPLDLRGTTMSHIGGDFYGDIGLRQFGSLSYTVYAGTAPQDPSGGYIYGTQAYGIKLTSLTGRFEGGDLRWHAPLTGFLAGVSYMNAAEYSKGTDYLGFPSQRR